MIFLIDSVGKAAAHTYEGARIYCVNLEDTLNAKVSDKTNANASV